AREVGASLGPGVLPGSARPGRESRRRAEGDELMEKNANYALVGLSTMILTVAVIVFVIWLGRLGFARDYDLYDIVFQGPVRGLNEGGEVHFNGIKVGEVTKIALDKTNPQNVITRVRVSEDVPIRVDSYAT